MVRGRPRCRRVAYTCAPHEDERAAHRAARSAIGRNPRQAAAPHWILAAGIPLDSKCGPAAIGEREYRRTTPHGVLRDEVTWHGFRTIASTCLNELGWNPDLIELQLAHAERNEVRGAYNRAQRLADRRQLMQAWADYLDGLRENTAKDAAELTTPDRFSLARSD